MTEYRKFSGVKQLPKLPSSITPLKVVNGECEDISVIIGGLNLVGESGYMCPTVTLLCGNEESNAISGWSLCLGDPEQKDEVPYFFDTAENSEAVVRGTEFPNTMVFFQAGVDSALTTKDAAIEKINEAIAYVLPHISDNGAPPPHPSEEVFVQAVHEWDEEKAQSEVTEVLRRAGIILDGVIRDFTDEWNDYQELFDEINKRYHMTAFSYAWKSDPKSPDYNPDLGVLEKDIGGRKVTVSVGLPNDGYAEPCAIVSITPQG